MEEAEFEEIKKRALEIASQIEEGHKYPIMELIDLSKRLSAYAMRLRFLAADMERKDSTKAKEAARGIDALVSVLKYEIKEFQNREYWTNR